MSAATSQPTDSTALAIPTVVAPGIYDLPADVYHSDPTDTPSLSAGMITDLLSAPALCRHNSRRLNPDWEAPEGQERFTIGTVSHIIFLEPDLFNAQVRVIDAPDWRSAAARERRDDALAKGQTPILEKHAAAVWGARRAFFINEFTARAFTNGTFEQSIFWRHPVYGFWCRARPDFIAAGGGHLCDYKATANANPDGFGKHAFSMGYHRRAAWYLEGAEIVLGRRPKNYWFANQEVKAPHLTSVCELDMQALEAGREENERAAGIFARCLQTDEWPGYRHRTDPSRDLAFQVGLPVWAYTQIEQRSI